MSDDKWKNIEEDKILSSSTPNTGEIAQYDRIMSKKMREAISTTNERVGSLGASLVQASSIVKESIEQISETIKKANESQSKQQKWMIILSAVLTVATIGYSIITAFTLVALNRSNTIQSKVFDTQNRQLELDKRPMLYIEIQPRLWTDGKSYYFGGELNYENDGSYLADDIDSEYLISNNIANKEVDFKNWYKDTYGSFPDIRAVPPHQKIGPLVLTPSFNKGASFVSISILSKYTGYDQKIKYWIKRLDIYNVQKDKNGNPEKLILIKSDTSINHGNESPRDTLECCGRRI